MATSFNIPKGSLADTAELEYISALHQSDPVSIRNDGSIIASDVKNYLMSRHGIEVSEPIVKNIIFNGTSLKPNNSNLDIVELASLLLIPNLLKSSCKLLTEREFLLKTKHKSELQYPHRYDYYKRNLEFMKSSLRSGNDMKIIRNILHIILSDLVDNVESDDKDAVTLSKKATPSILDTNLIKKILNKYGETYLQNNDELINAMLIAATNDEDDVVLDEKAFMRALTSDITLYDMHGDFSFSTHFYDAFGKNKSEFIGSKNNLPSMFADESNKERTRLNQKKDSSKTASTDEENLMPSYNPLVVKFTASSIDNQADSFRSKTFNTILWVSYNVIFMAYFTNSTYEWWSCKEGEPHYFWCLYSLSMTYYAIQFVLFSVTGTVYVCLASMGNEKTSSTTQKCIYTILSVATISVFNIISFFTEFDAYFMRTTKNWDSTVLSFCYYMSFISGWILLSIRLLALLEWTDEGTGGECCLKDAATYKITKMIHNADRMHKRSASSELLFDSKTRRVGGIAWTCNGILNGEIFRQEGIWISSRILSCFYALLFVTMATGLIGHQFIQNNLRAQSLMDQIDDFRDLSDLSLNAILFRDINILKGCAITGTIVAMLNSLFLATVLIPSYLTQTLKLRCGLTPTLRDDSGLFLILRNSVESVCVLFPSSFWGPLVSSLLIGFIIIVTLYTFCYSIGTDLGYHLYSTTFAILTLSILSWLLFMSIRVYYFVAFFRYHVMASNVFIVIVQCWYVGISILYTLTRLCILIILALVYAGRYDCLFLAPGIDFLRLDSMPLTFVKDILIHEAHRHPYIERLGVMYMLKLRHGNKFCNEAGSAWRLIFIHALMPWLRKYRLGTIETNLVKDEEDDNLENKSDDESQSDDDMSDQVQESEITEESSDVEVDDISLKRQEFKEVLAKMDSIMQYFANRGYANSSEAIDVIKEQMDFLQQQRELINERECALRLKIGQFQKDIPYFDACENFSGAQKHLDDVNDHASETSTKKTATKKSVTTPGDVIESLCMKSAKSEYLLLYDE